MSVNDELDDALFREIDDAELARKLKAAHWQLAAAESRAHLIKYATFMTPDPNRHDDPAATNYSVQPHHQLLADALMEVFEGRNLRLAISMPPQNGKSQLATRLGLAYHQGRFPWKHIIAGTYGQDFADEFGDDIRSLIESERNRMVFPDLQFRKGSKAKDHMVTSRGGKMSFIGRGGSGTGRPADGLLIDDPIKDAKEAASETIRDDVWNWFTRVANTRCHSLSWQIIIQTRWSEDDLIGRLTNPDNRHYDPEVAKQWTYINIPSIMDDEAIAAALGKKVGDALWPERFSLQLLDTARRLDPVGFSALHQGKPTPVEGAFYKVEHFARGYSSVSDLPKNMRYYLTGDLAVSTEITANKSAVGIWGLDDRDELWLLPELYWERKSSDQSVDQIIDFLKRYPIQEGFFEKGQLDRAIRPFLYKRMTEEKQYTPITGMPVAGSKGARSISFRGRCAQGKVHWPVFAPWWPKFKNVMLRFTGSGDDPEDDVCDMCALIGQALGNTFKADKPAAASNVIKVGTLQWTRWAADRERRMRARQKNIAGY